ncbi:phenylalanine--tRNA ligase subunit beta [Candidatus Berkelbacteria bacterium CG10_big_fil_rev_8_21_14_0_10_43_13]|uniref:Phenylalanine--tRNA ligase beta subunit n=1 Tax=Candidatus Berkelbacteria bacterium CG10_big_fil_rev_8_21_14_0_10_43_13 TaxID=1974514 RepID=A0A2H0W659_9BACT|nr:MAG: phenylalanine--tRNA ligase subunit beta [Candidatus Berkelbacteria bacterium CG10_big_fil_rev_8_21_14_0_10_43_13]
MKILRSWLEEYIKTSLSDEELADRLSLSGTAVESISKGIDDRVIVAEIKQIVPHPNADRLQLATVFTGDKELCVVCGAPNIEVGQKVPLAQVGTKLPAGTLEKATIRGVESSGMLCASDELGLGDDHNGIVILSADSIVGRPLNQYLGDSTVFDLEITPNRGDCLSHFGVAREVATLSDKFLKHEPQNIETVSKKTTDSISIEVASAKICPQYQARIIENVSVKESPKWLKDKLIAIGLKPINNIVDATNYVMIDLGQPLHAFDTDKIGKKIIVRKSKKAETITTLDGIVRTLDSKTIVITDEKKPIAIAGIMGGKNSEISESTSTVILEAAEFDPTSIRQSAKSLNLSTESSYRFERGIDSGGVEYALNQATKLISEISDGRALSGIARQIAKSEKVSIPIEFEKIIQLLGLDIRHDQIIHILKLLGFEISGATCTSPTWRHDIATWQDLAEEVGRIYGYSNISPIKIDKSVTPSVSEYYFTEFIKDILKNSGFSEIKSYAFLSEKDIKAAQIKPSSLLEVSNPIQQENKYLRNSLIPNLLKAVAKNPSFDQTFLFEIGHIFTKTTESNVLGIVAAGKEAKESMDLAIENLSKNAGIKKVKINEISRDELSRFKIHKPITYVVEIPLGEFAKKYLKSNQPKLKINSEAAHYRQVSKLPAITRDLAFIIDKKNKPSDVSNIIYSVSEAINRVELFDEFSSDKFGKGKKNIAFHLYVQMLDRTMTDNEADIIIKEVVKAVEKQFDAKLRS